MFDLQPIQPLDEESIAAVRERQNNLTKPAGSLGRLEVPEYPLSRLYRDIIGRTNQQLAAAADCVINMIAGIPQLIKGSLPDF